MTVKQRRKIEFFVLSLLVVISGYIIINHEISRVKPEYAYANNELNYDLIKTIDVYENIKDIPDRDLSKTVDLILLANSESNDKSYLLFLEQHSDGTNRYNLDFILEFNGYYTNIFPDTDEASNPLIVLSNIEENSYIGFDMVNEKTTKISYKKNYDYYKTETTTEQTNGTYKYIIENSVNLSDNYYFKEYLTLSSSQENAEFLEVNDNECMIAGYVYYSSGLPTTTMTNITKSSNIK